MAQSPQIDYRALILRVEGLAESIEPGEELTATIQHLASEILASMGPELGLAGGRLYIRQGSGFRLWSTFGDAKPARRGTRVPADYPPLQLALDQGTICMLPDDPEVDRVLEDELGAIGPFAAIEVGEKEFLLAFDLASEHSRQQVAVSLALLRYAINQAVRQERWEDVFRQAQLIQQSILPASVPRFGDFDIAFHSQPLETVGGDFIDLIPLTDKILGLAIADVSGHGLPAALQVRDIYMGLRMGTSRDFKIVRTIERLNQIIHSSKLTSRFVSMFYGELETDGTFIYVNAGHPPPLYLGGAGTVRTLTEGGMILGPLPEATYNRGYLTMRPGDILVLFTDGLVESAPLAGEFGFERLLAAMKEHRRLSAAQLVETILREVDGFSGGRPQTDDRTLLVVKRPP